MGIEKQKPINYFTLHPKGIAKTRNKLLVISATCKQRGVFM